MVQSLPRPGRTASERRTYARGKARVLWGVALLAALCAGLFVAAPLRSTDAVAQGAGAGWSASSAPLPASNGAGEGATIAPAPLLAAISCVSAQSCATVGEYFDDAGFTWGLIDSEAGGTWSSIAAPEPATNAAARGPGDETGNGNQGAQLTGVSCASRDFCVAVGSYQDADGFTWGLIDTYSGNQWSATAAPEPASNAAGNGPGDDSTNSNEDEQLSAVSCVAPGSCVAVGDYEDSAGFDWGVIETLAGGTWSAISAPEPATNAAGQAPGDEATNGDEQASLVAVSCAAAGSCTAVGSYRDAGRFDWGLIDTFSAGSWSSIAAPEPTGGGGQAAGDESSNLDQSAHLSAVSCAAATCAAAGSYADSTGHVRGLLDTLSGAGWSATPAPQPASNDAGNGPATDGGAAHEGATLTAVSCPAAGECRAAGSYADSAGYDWGWLARASGGQVTAAALSLPSANGLQVGPGDESNGEELSELLTVSCAAGGICAAGGHYRDANGADWGLLATSDGSGWDVAAAPVPPDATTSDPSGTDSSVTALSCSRDGSCVGVGQYLDSNDNPQGLLEILTPSAAAGGGGPTGGNGGGGGGNGSPGGGSSGAGPSGSGHGGGSGGGAGGTSRGRSPTGVRLLSSRIPVTSGVATVRIGCEHVACAGTLRLELATTARPGTRRPHGATTKPVKPAKPVLTAIGSARYAISAGRNATLRVHLIRSALSMLASAPHHLLRTTVVVLGRGSVAVTLGSRPLVALTIPTARRSR